MHTLLKALCVIVFILVLVEIGIITTFPIWGFIMGVLTSILTVIMSFLTTLFSFWPVLLLCFAVGAVYWLKK